MKIFGKTITRGLISIALVIGLCGCNSMLSSKMPVGSISMAKAYRDAINGSSQSSLQNLRDKVSNMQQPVSFEQSNTNMEKNNNYQLVNSAGLTHPLFKRLPNPSIFMYIYPHEAGTEKDLVPIPGYFTKFSLYRRVHYAASN